jgi:hypothetical protein
MKKPDVLHVTAPKPRNRFAVLARRRAAGAHQVAGRKRGDQEEKDLVQQLREAGLL